MLVLQLRSSFGSTVHFWSLYLLHFSSSFWLHSCLVSLIFHLFSHFFRPIFTKYHCATLRFSFNSELCFSSRHLAHFSFHFCLIFRLVYASFVIWFFVPPLYLSFASFSYYFCFINASFSHIFHFPFRSIIHQLFRLFLVTHLIWQFFLYLILCLVLHLDLTSFCILPSSHFSFPLHFNFASISAHFPTKFCLIFHVDFPSFFI